MLAKTDELLQYLVACIRYFPHAHMPGMLKNMDAAAPRQGYLRQYGIRWYCAIFFTDHEQYRGLYGP